MKKIAVILVSLLIAFSFAACGEKTENDGVVKLYDFEQSGIRAVGMNRNFGKIELNELSDYVSSGNRSLALTPMGTDTVQPFMFLPLKSDLLGFDYSDATKITEVRFSVYAQRDAQLLVGLYFSNEAELKGSGETFSVSDGWNELVYSPDYSLIDIQYNLKACNGIYFQFQRPSDTTLPDKFFLDDVRLVLSETAVVYDNLIVLNKTATYFEITDFERAYQQLVFVPHLSANAPAPLLETVIAADYDVVAPSGNKVLRIVTYPKSDTSITWSQINMSNRLIDALELSRYWAEPENYELKFEIYQNCDREMMLEVNAYYAGTAMDWGAVVTKKGEWVTFSASLANFTNFLRNPERFAFGWRDYADGGESEYFFDNFRIEKIS